jgi:hypothetical protein
LRIDPAREPERARRAHGTPVAEFTGAKPMSRTVVPTAKPARRSRSTSSARCCCRSRA